MGLSKIVQDLGQFIDHNAPSILTGVAVTGVFTTTIMAIDATPKALRMLEIAEENRVSADGKNSLDLPLDNRDILRITWRCYAPAALSGLITISAIVGANSINIRRQAVLASAYSILDIALREYQERVIDMVGEKKAEEIEGAIVQAHLDQKPIEHAQVILSNTGDFLMYDDLSGRYFRGSIELVRRAVNDFNEEILNGDSYKPLNDFYFAIGLPDVEIGNNMGWDLETILKVDFHAKIATDGEPCVVLKYKTTPKHL